jgi:hypothetical protein
MTPLQWGLVIGAVIGVLLRLVTWWMDWYEQRIVNETLKFINRIDQDGKDKP